MLRDYAGGPNTISIRTHEVEHAGILQLVGVAWP